MIELDRIETLIDIGCCRPPNAFRVRAGNEFVITWIEVVDVVVGGGGASGWSSPD